MIGNRSKQSNKKTEKKNKRVSSTMGTISNKLVIFFSLILLAFAFLLCRVLRYSLENGEQFKKQVLSQQTYNSTTLPYKRGSIEDRNGMTLAHSILVYNMIIDCKELNENAEQIEPTLVALGQCFSDEFSANSISTTDLRNYIRENPTSAYHIVLKQLTYEQIRDYQERVSDVENNICENGIWFEEGYKREYPNGRLAADVIGFTTKDDRGQYGLEEFYETTLAGTNGRTFGYRTEDYGMEYNVIPATNGYTLVTTIDSYIQKICEENLLKYNQEHANAYREGEDGSDNTGVIIMDIDSGEVLAMASYPFYDLSDPYDISDYYTEDEIKAMEENGTLQDTLNGLWKNFCVSQSYEPGSVCKTFTIASGLDSGILHDGDTYFCPGYHNIGEGNRQVTIRCHNKYGEGQLTVKGALEQSCNVALLQMGHQIGSKTFLKYFNNFNFGLKTNVDLAGEMRTDSLVFTEDTMGVTELATSSFGQGYNVTMMQVISAYCSLINGGYLYQPHLVSKIVDDNGATVENIEPVMLRQTVSEKTSRYLRDYCMGVVQNGTGKKARPAGYMIGGKTGTAEHSGAGKVDYVVSFIGFAPADNPQIAIYVVIDRPNTPTQDTATQYACLLCKDILTDVLPYLNIYMTEELSEAEKEALAARGGSIIQESMQSESENAISENEAYEDGEEKEVIDLEIPEEENGLRDDIKIDPETGYVIDPVNGEFLDPETGVPINGEGSIFQDANGKPLYGEVEQPAENNSQDEEVKTED